MSDQKLAYVTGGMGGIGTAICRRLHDAGFNVVAGCGPSRDHAKWIEEQAADGYTFHTSVGNVGDWDSCKAAFDQVREQFGNPDVLVNNAGITRDGVFRRMSADDWRAVIDTNLNSLFYVTKQVIEGMVEKGWGRVINISSINGQRGQFGQVNYSAAKAGIYGFTMALAQEVASKGVTVNVVSRIDGDQATSSSHLQLVITGAKGAHILFTGRYEDTLRRVNGEWLFAQRKLHQDMPAASKTAA
jgi:acetoacetyl-CoA reductase